MRATHRFALVLAATLLALASPAPGSAQDTSAVAIGTSVRLRLPSSTLTGTLTGGRDDWLAIANGADTTVVARARIVELARLTGRANRGRPVMIGLLVGLGIGLAVGAIGMDSGTGECFCDADAVIMAIGGIGAGVGGLIGIGVGLTARDAYLPIPRPWGIVPATRSGE